MINYFQHIASVIIFYKMNFTDAFTNSGYNFLRFHEKFSHVIKTNAIGLILLEKEIENGITEDQMAQIISKGEWRNLWGGMPAWNQPFELVKQAIRGLGQDGVARVFSAFDVFLNELSGEISTVEKLFNIGVSDKTIKIDTNDEDKLWKFLERNEIELENIDAIKPIYRYYRISRDCIVHRNGLASPNLYAIAGQKELTTSVKNWKVIADHKTILPIRKMDIGDNIEFTHQDAIFASDLLFRMTRSINRSFIKRIGADGIVYLIAKRNILSGFPEPRDQIGRNCYSYIAGKLRNIYRVKDFEQSEVTHILKEKLKLSKECYKRYEEIKQKLNGQN